MNVKNILPCESAVKVVFFRQLPECLFVFGPVGLYICITVVPAERTADKIAAAHLVEHIEPVVGCMIKHFVLRIEL